MNSIVTFFNKNLNKLTLFVMLSTIVCLLIDQFFYSGFVQKHFFISKYVLVVLVLILLGIIHIRKNLDKTISKVITLLCKFFFIYTIIWLFIFFIALAIKGDINLHVSFLIFTVFFTFFIESIALIWLLLLSAWSVYNGKKIIKMKADAQAYMKQKNDLERLLIYASLSFSFILIVMFFVTPIVNIWVALNIFVGFVVLLGFFLFAKKWYDDL